MKRLLIASLIPVLTLLIAACEEGGGSATGPLDGPLTSQHLGNSAAACVSRTWNTQPDFRTFEWNGNRPQGFVIFDGSGYSRTNAQWSMKPESGGTGYNRNFRRAEGQLFLQQDNSEVLVSSALGGVVNLSVVDGLSQRNDVNLQCVSNAAFQRPAGNSQQIWCRSKLTEFSGRNSARHDRNEVTQVFNWYGGNELEREMQRGRRGEQVFIRIRGDGRLEIEGRNLDGRKNIKAEAMINEGLEIRYRGRSVSSELLVTCAPASK